MAQVFSDLDPTFIWAVLLLLGALIAGWALRVACSVCSVEPPDFWYSVLAVVIICISNIMLQFWLRQLVFQAKIGGHRYSPDA